MTMAVEKIKEDFIEPQVVHDIARVIRENEEFLIMGHLRPDGDCLGSGLGLLHLLRGMGKRAEFFTVGPMPDYLEFLPGFDEVLTTPPSHIPKTIIYVDSGDPLRVSETFLPQGYLINIDHHLSNSQFGQLNWVDIEATAAGEQIYRLALVLEQPFTPTIATCLYTAMMTDSGGFRYANTDQVTFQAAAHLVAEGAKPAEIAQEVYETKKRQSVVLTGLVYSNLQFEFENRFVWAEITQETYNKVGGDEFEPDGLSSDMRGIAGVEIAVLFHETKEGWFRAGLRSKSAVNVSALATKLGGGGHYNASGCYVKKPYVETREWALGLIREYLRPLL
ncbi:MAG: bifunctional oligoribonuclease/PAP phosphatase NrnA [Candidatus Sumerlaeaceae bacterium]|nr:bifunctional oligoribonuclease/PAP phosphatase NrnA [Candidatus Sumerlaeaceae bacterium]